MGQVGLAAERPVGLESKERRQTQTLYWVLTTRAHRTRLRQVIFADHRHKSEPAPRFDGVTHLQPRLQEKAAESTYREARRAI